LINLGLQGLVFRQLALQKTYLEGSLVGLTLRGKHVNVAKLVFTLAKVVHFHKALVDQGIKE
jgi:hypothetical protein